MYTWEYPKTIKTLRAIWVGYYCGVSLWGVVIEFPFSHKKPPSVVWSVAVNTSRQQYFVSYFGGLLFVFWHPIISKDRGTSSDGRTDKWLYIYDWRAWHLTCFFFFLFSLRVWGGGVWKMECLFPSLLFFELFNFIFPHDIPGGYPPWYQGTMNLILILNINICHIINWFYWWIN
jgi:hypothetical protein